MDHKNYIKLAQLQAARFECIDRADTTLEELLKDYSNINYQIPATTFLKSEKSELIGNTVLHLATKNQLSNLIERGADFTIKNDAGQTVLHKTINHSEGRYKACWTLKGKLKHSEASLILSAQVKFKNSNNPCDKNGLSHLHIACMINHIEAIEYLLNSGVNVNESVNVNSPYLLGYTPLHIAARYCSFEASDLLIKHGADVSLKNSKGITPLHLLIERNMEIMDYIHIGERAAYDYFKEEYLTNEKIVKLLIENNKNEDKSAVDCIGLSSFQVLCTLQDITIVEKLLLKKNLNLEHHISMNSPVWPGYTALHFAAHFNFKIVKLLLRYGANIHLKDAKGKTAFDLCLQRFKPEDLFFLVMSHPDGEDIRFSDNEMRLADLLFAMRDQHLLKAVLQKMFKNVNTFIPHDSLLWPGFSPLHLAVILSDRTYNIDDLYKSSDYKAENSSKNYYNCDEAENEMCYQRIKVCLKLNCDVTAKDAHGSTPIHLAFPLLKSSTINSLLDNQNKMFNPTDKNGLSHLHIACATGNFEFVEKLLWRNMDVNSPVTCNYEFKRTAGSQSLFISRGSTPLHIAVAVNHVQLVRLLLRHKANRYAQDDDGLTPIHLIFKISVHNRQIEMSQHLLSLNSLKDYETSFGFSHLHIASCVNNRKAIETLLDNGANIEATVTLASSVNGFNEANDSLSSLSFLTPYNGSTPLHLAVERKNITATATLLKRGANILAKKLNNEAPYNDVLKRDSFVHNAVVKTIEEDTSLQESFLKSVGMTLLHIACATLNVDAVKELLSNRADPNVRLHLNSPFWPGFTPLHTVLIKCNNDGDKITKILQLLFDYGADVTLADRSGSTPLHQLFEQVQYEGSDLLGFLLENQKDYTINPINATGVSHFHIACMSTDKNIVQKFLRQNVNVNLTTDHFDFSLGGQTPLHMALYHRCKDNFDLLLKHGANVHLGDHHGNTPFHFAARHAYSLKDYFYNLISAGADINAKNILGETPFEKLAEAYPYREDVKLFIKHGCRLNSYNPFTQEGFIGISISNLYGDDEIIKNAFYKVLIKSTNVSDSDEMGRTPLHNIASSSGPTLDTDAAFVEAIRRLIKRGYDIDHQDNRGYTALHTSILFQNNICATALLKNGTDINITDSSGKTALSYASEIENGLRKYFLGFFSEHMFKLQLVHIWISELNKSIYSSVVARYVHVDKTIIERYYLEIDKLKNTKLGSFDVTLFDFLSETGAVAAYPRMPLEMRQTINRTFLENDLELSTNFPEFYGLLRLQYTKTLERMNLLDPSKHSLDSLVGFNIPDLCSSAVLRFLSNKDLLNLISSLDDDFQPRKRRRLS